MLRYLLGEKLKIGGNGHFACPPDKLIDLAGVIKAYKTDAGDFLALKGVNLTIGNGEFVGVIGKSGSGKSTLINMIAGIDRPTKGEIVIGGTPVHKLSEGKMAKWRGRNMGIVFQFFQLLPMLTVIENVMLPMDFCGYLGTGARKQRALSLLEQVGVAQHANKLPNMLSGGEQQRVAIARALANDPPIILADEPTGNLDSKTAEMVFHLFEGLVESGKTIVMVTHDHDLAKRVRRTIVIADGEIIEEQLARTFPTLTQPDLIWLTLKLTRERYAPGTVILTQGEPAKRFYIITKGTADVLVKTRSGTEIAISELNRGHYFGETGILNEGASIATVKAGAEEETGVISIDKATFAELLARSETTRRDIEKLSGERITRSTTAGRKEMCRV
jgi:ABC-type lipoprotein export system ATPase subunit